MISKKQKIKILEEYLDMHYPDVECELNFSNNLELLIAVLLSAQCKDEYVNRATAVLFSKYHTVQDYANASAEEIESYIKTLGLYKAKSKNIKKMAQLLIDEYSGEVPNKLEDLMRLPGVGRKTANVVLSVGFAIPTIAVDTHVERIAKRFDLALEEDSPLEVEMKLMKIFPKKKWSKIHHQMIHFGRYECLAKRKRGHVCGLKDICKYHSKVEV
ncbi:endonuclease III [Gemella sp. WT2a]|nr:endonuclease III [Gemella sp. WT2a]